MPTTENDIGGNTFCVGGYELPVTTFARRARKRPWTVLLSAAFVSMGVLSYSASGNFTAAATVANATRPQHVSVLLGAEGSPERVDLIAPSGAPGEAVQHALDVTVAPKADGLRGAVLTTSAPPTDPAGVRLWISRCTEPWNEVSSPSGRRLVCPPSGRMRDVLGTSVAPVALAQQDSVLGNITMQPGAVNHLRVQMTLPPNPGTAVPAFADVALDVAARRSQAG
jgi:hypothetical protein